MEQADRGPQLAHLTQRARVKVGQLQTDLLPQPVVPLWNRLAVDPAFGPTHPLALRSPLKRFWFNALSGDPPAVPEAA